MLEAPGKPDWGETPPYYLCSLEYLYVCGVSYRAVKKKVSIPGNNAKEHIL